MELERQFIVRTDFASVRRGYDQEEVDLHLREVAQAVEGLKRASRKAAPRSAGSMASVASEQVRTIVDAAERSAAEIEATATLQADRVTGEATRQAEQDRSTARGEADRVRREAEEAARETLERAEADAAKHVADVKEATTGMRARADTIESDLTGLVDQLRTTVESVVESVRSSAGSLESELATIHAGLAEVREAKPVPEPEAALEPEPEIIVADEPTMERAVEASHDEGDAEPAEQELGFDEPGAGVADRDEPEAARDAEPDAAQESQPAASSGGESSEGARLIALNMALNGTPREETERYLEENFDLEDQDAILDEVYARVGG